MDVAVFGREVVGTTGREKHNKSIKKNNSILAINIVFIIYLI